MSKLANKIVNEGQGFASFSEARRIRVFLEEHLAVALTKANNESEVDLIQKAIDHVDAKLSGKTDAQVYQEVRERLGLAEKE